MLCTLHAEGRLLCETGMISDGIIVQSVNQFPGSIVLTVSKAACARINEVLVSHLFSALQPLAVIRLDNDREATPVYRGMRVVITQNRDKPRGVINGQKATVHLRQGNTIVLRLDSGSLVAVHPVSSLETQTGENATEETIVRTCYPFVYAITICKAQGQTLDNVIIWFDCQTLAPGCAYVALSRVRSFANVRFLAPLSVQHFRPVHYPL